MKLAERIENPELTEAQARTIKRVRETLLYNQNERFDFQRENPCHEIKEESVYGLDGWRKVSYTIVIGRIGDEGTYAQIFARDRRHLHIGPRGGLTLTNAKTKRKSRGFFNAVHGLTAY